MSKWLAIPFSHANVALCGEEVLELLVSSLAEASQYAKAKEGWRSLSRAILIQCVFFVQLINISKLQSDSRRTLKSIIHAFFSSWLDYSKALFKCLDKLSLGNCSCFRMLQRKCRISRRASISLLSSPSIVAYYKGSGSFLSIVKVHFSHSPAEICEFLTEHWTDRQTCPAGTSARRHKNIVGQLQQR